MFGETKARTFLNRKILYDVTIGSRSRTYVDEVGSFDKQTVKKIFLITELWDAMCDL